MCLMQRREQIELTRHDPEQIVIKAFDVLDVDAGSPEVLKQGGTHPTKARHALGAVQACTRRVTDHQSVDQHGSDHRILVCVPCVEDALERQEYGVLIAFLTPKQLASHVLFDMSPAVIEHFEEKLLSRAEDRMKAAPATLRVVDDHASIRARQAMT